MSLTNTRWNVSQYRKLLSHQYTELRFQENRRQLINLLNGDITRNISAAESGVSARSFFNGGWGFSSHPEMTSKSIEKVIFEAGKNANFMGSKNKTEITLRKISGAKNTVDLSTKKPSLSTSDLIDRMKAYDNYLVQNYSELTSRNLLCWQQDFIKEGINSESAETYSHYARSYLRMEISISSPTGDVSLQHDFGHQGQFEDTFPDFETFKSGTENLYRKLKDKSKGTLPESGFKEVILSSKLAGILAHEAVGHPTEADLVFGGAITANLLNQQVASPLITLVDFAHTVYGKQAPMPVLFDDEGTPAEDTVIIENGILKTFMNNKESAVKLNQKATGHARAWGFNDEPLIRMRNTAIVPGTSKIEDMIASVDDGYYLIDHSNGQADSTSEFMFGVTMGYEIKKGKLARALLDTTISGMAFDMLKTVTQVSDELTWVSAGTCGKKQPMTVGMGGPAVKCKLHVGGK